MFYAYQRGDATIIEVHEDIDIVTNPVLASTIHFASLAGPTRVIVSFERCRYCEASGLTTLIRAKDVLGSRLRVVVPSGSRVRRIFAITGLEEKLSLYESVASAFCAVEACRTDRFDDGDNALVAS